MIFSIVATLYNKSNESLQTFLEALKRQSRKDFELVLVDDCSDLDYQSVISKYTIHYPIKYIRFGSNRGQCHARNIGIRETKGDIICIVDSDCIPNEHFVAAHCIGQRDHQVRDVLIGAYNIESNGCDIWNLLSELQKDKQKLHTEMGLQYPGVPGYFINFITRNVSIKRSALPIRPLFDEDFSYRGTDPSSGFGWEDVEAGYSLFRAGLNFGFTDDAFTVHLSHPSTTDDITKPMRSMRNFNKLLLKHPQMIYTQALPWLLDTYQKICQWLNETHTSNVIFDTKVGPSIRIVVQMNDVEQIYHPMVLENILSQWKPGIEIEIITKNQSNIIKYYSDTHSYIHVSDEIHTSPGVSTIYLSGDQLLDPDRLQRCESVRRVQIHQAPKHLGGFQTKSAFFEKNLIPLMTHKKRYPSRPLKILTYRWHCGHQYELWKLPHKFTIAEDHTTMAWDYTSRPLHSNVNFVHMCDIDQRDYDLALLHFDENCINPSISNGVLGPEWGAIFRRFVHEINEIPRVAICHGTPPFHGMFDVSYQGKNLMQDWTEEINKIRNFVGDLPIICNSWNAWDQWKFPNSRVIWQGFDSNDYPIGSRTKGMVYCANSIRHRPWYRGYYDFKYLSKKFPIDYLGRDDYKEFRTIQIPEPNADPRSNDYAWAKFENYQNTIGDYSIFVNTTLRSPMPRSRGEAMLKGLCAVTMDFHDESMFIENGVNGFVGKSKEELEEHLRWCVKNPYRVKEIGLRGRETMRRVFPHTRYLKEWQETLVDILGE